MRRVLLIALAVSTMGMGGKRPVIPGDNGNLPAPQPYQDRFKTIGNQYGAAYINQSATFGWRNFLGSTIGMCTWSSRSAKVEFSPSAWGGGSDTFREMLAFHELGHCLLGRGHKNTRTSNGRIESLMNSYIFDEKTYLANRDEYLRELFQAENNRAVAFMAVSRDFGPCSFGK
jgi:hypothetical protein